MAAGEMDLLHDARTSVVKESLSLRLKYAAEFEGEWLAFMPLAVSFPLGSL